MDLTSLSPHDLRRPPIVPFADIRVFAPSEYPDPPESTDNRPTTSRAPGERSSIGVLVVDDNVRVRATLREALAKEPALDVIGEAADGLTAVQLVQELAPQVVLMDVYMPRLNGIETTRRIHATTPHTVITGMSSDVQSIIEQKMLSAGARVFVAKESIMLDLPAVIRQHLPE